jgi:FecR protein
MQRRHLLALGLGLGLPVWAAQPLTQATIMQSVADLQIQRGLFFTRSLSRDVVQPGDTVATGSLGQADVLFDEGSFVRLGANTRFRFGQGGREFYLERGAFWLSVPPNNGGLQVVLGNIRLEAPGGSIVVLRRADNSVQVIVTAQDPRGILRVTQLGRSVANLAGGQVLTVPALRNRRPLIPRYLDLIPLFNSELFSGLLAPELPITLDPKTSLPLQEALRLSLGELRQALARQEELVQQGILIRK